MIALTDVSKIYNDSTTAVDELSFTVQKGEIFGLVGTSGCGKTTTLKMINRLVEPTSGSIAIDGRSILEQPPQQLRRDIGYVIQNVGLFPHYSVRQNIAITPKLLGWQSGRINERCDELLELVGLAPDTFADRMPAALSGGQQQRVGLARALAADPPVILMDEPFGGVDPITKEHIQQEFKKLLREIRKTIVFVTHDVFEAFELCDRICLMDEGRRQQTGTPRELLFKPSNEFVRSFFDNHRFQLEMMSITVEDILETLNLKNDPQQRPTLKEDGRFILPSASFYEVFENQVSEDKRCQIKDEDGHLLGKINADQLLEGFQKVRRKFKEEQDA